LKSGFSTSSILSSGFVRCRTARFFVHQWQQPRLNINRMLEAKTSPFFVKNININGIPNNAYAIKINRLNSVFGVMFPYLFAYLYYTLFIPHCYVPILYHRTIDYGIYNTIGSIIASQHRLWYSIAYNGLYTASQNRLLYSIVYIGLYTVYNWLYTVSQNRLWYSIVYKGLYTVSQNRLLYSIVYIGLYTVYNGLYTVSQNRLLYSIVYCTMGSILYDRIDYGIQWVRYCIIKSNTK
jgi:hypothetical protein